MKGINSRSLTFVFAIVVIAIVAGLTNMNYVSTGSINYPASFHASTTGGDVFIQVPAVDSNGKGALGIFEVKAVPGSGKILTNINHLLFFVDTQFSIQTARNVAANVTGIDASRYDLIYDITSETNDTGAVEGPSAGAALTIATIAALENKTIEPNVMITGTIEPDGTIGKVGGVDVKAQAVKDGGANLFLVPVDQGLEDSYKPATSCEPVGMFKVCRTSYEKILSLQTDGSGLVVKEVSNIREALKYFVQ